MCSESSPGTGDSKALEDHKALAFLEVVEGLDATCGAARCGTD